MDNELDDHNTHMTTIQEFAASPAGRRARVDNPQGYLNVKLHFAQHQLAAAAILAQQQAAAATATTEGGQTTSDSGQPSA